MDKYLYIGRPDLFSPEATRCSGWSETTRLGDFQGAVESEIVGYLPKCSNRYNPNLLDFLVWQSNIGYIWVHPPVSSGKFT